VAHCHGVLRLQIAHSKGPGFGLSRSTDGGLTGATNLWPATARRAYRGMPWELHRGFVQRAVLTKFDHVFGNNTVSAIPYLCLVVLRAVCVTLVIRPTILLPR
jgi:hypothetical protein